MSISCGRHWSRKRMWRRSFCIELHWQFLCVDTTPAAPSSALHFIVVFCFYLLYHLSNHDFDTWPICVVELRIFRTYIPGSVGLTPGTYVDLSSFSLYRRITGKLLMLSFVSESVFKASCTSRTHMIRWIAHLPHIGAIYRCAPHDRF
jgi:hypothetical protein